MQRLTLIYCHIVMYTVYKQLKGVEVETELSNIFNSMLSFACHHYAKKGYTSDDLKSIMAEVMVGVDDFIIKTTTELGVFVYEEYIRNK